ncbi:MAG TPA: extradiol dioxygenase [Candidatus Dormibacteraeota bacterium]|nr:extradiol dioxygenase [Candidatus Dormibacteraeota bacterium]
MKQSLTGAHVIIGSSDPDSDRAFLRDVFELDSVDAGGGWLIFALPPAEVAVHPGKNGEHRLYLMCTNLDSVLHELKAKGVPMKMPVSEQPWGTIASITMPGGSELALYEPRHPRPKQ